MKISLNITRIIASTLFIYMWATGIVSGVLAWFILFLLIDVKFEIKR